MEEQVLNAALAGLLHDVGKFAQRTALGSSRIWDEDARREYKYEHAVFSGDFVERYLPAPFKPLSPPAYHHAPKSDFDRLIQRADSLSAGEREPERGRHPKRLRSIFTRLSLGSQAANGQPRYHALQSLRLEQGVLFPTQTTEQDDAGAYEKLWGDFAKAADDLKRVHERQPHLETYLESLLGLMQQYTWCIPSAYYADVPDVSLYDHSRSTAAIAVCLAGSGDTETTALLVGGDISGVQKFIYTLSSRKAAQTLRGRSFYLQLLTEAILHYVLRELGLPYTNVIYSGGGHFYLLAPVSAKGKLPGIRKYVTETLLTHHGSALYLALECAEITANGFGIGELPNHWDAMHRALNRAKQQRYTELGDDFYKRVFEPQAHGGNRQKTCSVCGEEREDAELSPEPDDPESNICGLCKSFWKDIGGRLPQARFVALGLCEPKPAEQGGALEVFRAFGLQVAFAQNANDLIEFGEAIERAVLWALDDPTNGWPTVKDVPAARMLRYTVNLVPPKDFNELQEDSHGIARLGVLRMDVDNLGDLFKDGFGPKGNSIATLARISALSFQLSLFFEGWVRRLCEAYPDLIYAVYAGGDDVFLIGPWDKMPHLSARIAEDFKAFAAENPDVHLSGGMAFIHGKYPVYQAADDAHEMLEDAKGLDGKDAFGFLGQAWKWSEFAKVTDKFSQLVKLVSLTQEGGLGYSEAILQLLRKLADDRKTDVRKRVIWGPWMWQIAYHFSRRIDEEKRKHHAEIVEALAQIHQSLKDDNFGNLSQWGAAARWAQLFLRERDDGR
jgi:CRISPR-associated protein Csm1